MKIILILTTLAIILTGCRSTFEPYVIEIWEAGDYNRKSSLGYKGGSIQFEQIVLYEDKKYVWIKSYGSLGLFSTRRIKSNGIWGVDKNEKYIIEHEKKMYFKDIVSHAGNPYESTSFIKVFNHDNKIVPVVQGR